MDGLRMGKMVIQPMHFPDRKRPSLMIFEDPNRYVKVATFSSEESAEAFMKYLFAMVGLEAEDCDGCRYHNLGPSDDPCYECRRNYYDRYKEEAEGTEEEDEDAFW